MRVLGITDDARKAQILKNPVAFRIAPWHFDPRHRVRAANGNWTIRKMPKYKDGDNKVFDYPPPNYSVQQFIDSEIEQNHVTVDTLPSWAKDMIKLHQNRMDIDPPTQQRSNSTPAPTPNRASNKVPRVVTPPSAPRPPPRKRQSPIDEALEEKTDELRIKEAELASALERLREVLHLRELDQATITELQNKVKQLEDCKARLDSKLSSIESDKRLLSYEDLAPGGILNGFCNDFSFFPNFAITDAFLDALNYGDYSDDTKELGGLCENLVRYSKVSIQRRKEYNNLAATLSGDEIEDGASKTPLLLLHRSK